MLQKEVFEGIIWEQEVSELTGSRQEGGGGRDTRGNEWWKGSRRE